MAVVCSGKEKHGKHSMRKVFGVLKMVVDSEHCMGCWENHASKLGNVVGNKMANCVKL